RAALDVGAEPAGHGQHALVEVQADHPAPAAHPVGGRPGHHRGAAGHVEHGLARGDPGRLRPVGRPLAEDRGDEPGLVHLRRLDRELEGLHRTGHRAPPGSRRLPASPSPRERARAWGTCPIRGPPSVGILGAMTEVEALATGRDALAAGRWEEARAAFAAALADGETPEALDGMGVALWWLGETRASVTLTERAYAGFRRAGDIVSAAGGARSLCATRVSHF